MKSPISITGISTISALGQSTNEVKKAYTNTNAYFTIQDGHLVSAFNKEIEADLEKLRQENIKYQQLDKSVLMALLTSRQVMQQVNWKTADFGVNIGSSRGATTVFEQHHANFIKTNKADTLSSPTTTLGNISSWVAHDLKSTGPDISHSITCSTALHAVLNGVAWLESGRCNQFLIGGSEACLTPFTIAQMQALKIYSKDQENPYPCQAMNLDKTRNSMILGEAAGSVAIESGLIENRKAQILGIGYATEILTHNVSMSADGDCFKKSMTMALKDANLDTVDVIVTHTAGTKKGDQAEITAINNVFTKAPAVTNNKWKVGHSLGASGVMSLDLAIIMLQTETFVHIPFYKQETPKQLKTVMVNAVGFGGNAVSIILKK